MPNAPTPTSTESADEDDRVLVLNLSTQPIHAAVFVTRSAQGKPGRQDLVTTVPGPNAVPAKHVHLFEGQKTIAVGEDAVARWKFEAGTLIKGALSLQGLRWVQERDKRQEVQDLIAKRIAELKSRKAT